MREVLCSLADYCIAAGLSDIPQLFHSIGMYRKPDAIQIEDLNHCMMYERFGLFNDAGVGKTLPMQATMLIYTLGYGNKGLVIMPPTLIGQFVESFLDEKNGNFSDLGSYIKISALEGSKEKKEKLLSKMAAGGAPDILVLGYQVFSDMHPIKPSKEKVITNSKTGKSWTRPAVKALREHPLKKFGYNVLFFDESHALKNPTSGISRKVYRYIRETEGEYCVGLFTGSPIPNTPEDALGTIRILTPDIYRTKREFERHHVVLNKNSPFRQVLGYVNLEKLNEILMSHGRRVTKQEAIKDLPPMVPNLTEVNLSKVHLEAYRSLIKKRVIDLPGNFIDATQQQTLRQIALQMVATPQKYIEKFIEDEVENALLTAVEKRIAEINPFQNKIILCAYFKSTVKFLAEYFEQLRPAVINGATGDKDAERLDFIEDPDCRMLVMNWTSGGVGLNLQIANHIIFYETPTVPKDAIQTIARSWRRGQEKTTYVDFYSVLKTISAKSLDQLLDKEIQANVVVQDKHKMLKELLGE